MRLVTAALVAAYLFAAFHTAAGAQSGPRESPAPVATPAAGAALTADQLKALQEQIVKASQNPVGNIAIVPFQSNFNYGAGPYNRLQFVLNVQPVVPIAISPNLTLVARTIIPFIEQPSFAPPAVCATPLGCGSITGMGDILEQLFFAPKTKPDALIWGAGPQLSFPTSTDPSLGSGKYSAGPAVVALVMPGRFVIGALATQLWSFASKDRLRPEVSSFLVQPFVNYNLPGLWAISSAPNITANWNNAPPGQRWTVPVGAGVSKTFKLGDQPMQVGLFYYTNVKKPTYAPQTTLRFNWALLFPIKRGRPPLPGG
jgi:hypothetical protein